jgi:hypothetical protein
MCYEYLQSECPLVLGCLWDITDKDTDELTKELINIIMSKYKKGIDFAKILR